MDYINHKIVKTIAFRPSYCAIIMRKIVTTIHPTCFIAISIHIFHLIGVNNGSIRMCCNYGTYIRFIQKHSRLDSEWK